ncbi:MAG: HAMP domain-containing histidine kinase [Acidobacteria bacterium]|nr:HAMP domain-containing histidine kinase [Acidobacteriota bacterium]
MKHITGQQTGADPAAVNVRTVLDDLAMALGPAFRKSPHRLEVDAPDLLPLKTRGIELGRVLLNLVQNCLVHAFPKGTAGTVRLEARGSDGGVVITVADTGSGMPPDVAARAFDLYYTTRRDEGGTGLGLSVVKDLVEGSLQGRISLQTSPGAGTIFRITLPNIRG